MNYGNPAIITSAYQMIGEVIIVTAIIFPMLFALVTIQDKLSNR